jgi:hypothetical protein
MLANFVVVCVAVSLVIMFWSMYRAGRSPRARDPS